MTHPYGKHHIVFVKYEFVSALEHEVNVKHHSNETSCSIPYLRTYKSMHNILKRIAKEKGKGLKRGVHEVATEVENLEKCNRKTG